MLDNIFDGDKPLAKLRIRDECDESRIFNLGIYQSIYGAWAVVKKNGQDIAHIKIDCFNNQVKLQGWINSSDNPNYDQVIIENFDESGN